MAEKRQGLIQQALNRVTQTAQRIFPGVQQEFAKTSWGRTLTSPAAQSFGKSLANTVQQGVPAAYRTLTPVASQITLGKVNQKLAPRLKAGDQVKDAFNTVKLGATAIGLPKLGMTTALTSTGLGAAFNKFGGGSFLEGAGQGLGTAGTIAGIGKITNPLINKTASALTQNIASPVRQFAANRLATGVLNVPEGMVMQGSTSGLPYTLGDAALDFGLGAAGGQTLTGNRGAVSVAKSMKGYSPVKDYFQRVMDRKDKFGNVFMRYDTSLGDSRLNPNTPIYDGDLYKDAANLWRHVYGNHKNNIPPANISDIITDLKGVYQGVSTEARMRAEGITLGAVQNGKVANQPKGDIAISSDAIKTKDGKIKVQGYPTQTEIKNRAEVGAGNPDLYTQRTGKLERAGIPTTQGVQNSGPLPWETTGPAYKIQTPSSSNQSGPTAIGKILQSKVQQTPQSARVSESSLSRSQQQSRQVEGSRPLKDIVDSSGFDVNKKVGILDMFRTPDRVLRKMGLGKESDQLRASYDNYIKELPGEIDKITAWSKQVPKESNQRIFQYLDGGGVKLNPQEQKVATEIKEYLKGWADRLGLPEDSRVSHYITHIFERELMTKEIDPDIAKIIRERVAGSVYDPFLEKRLGAIGYKEDTWGALDAYVKRATRKANLDPTLKTISEKSENFEESQFDYVKSYIARVNMQPTKIDNMIDNSIKQVIGYKLGARPITVITRAMRQAGYRGALGLNVGSALRNLTQFSNTYARLGEKYTAIGYTKLAKSMVARDDELERVGVLRNDFVQDRTMNATKKFWEKTDKGLFALFELAERINRGSAYYGAKSQYLNKHKGASEQAAVEYAKKVVRDTQFTFGSVDTPKILSSDIGKTFGQFQSYNLKQAEFLGEMIKKKDIKGLTRYTIASLAMMATIGELIGIQPQDMIPFSGVATGDSRIGQTPAINAINKLREAAMNSEDQYGNELSVGDRLKTATDAVVPLIPGGVQIKKTIEGLSAADKGYSESKTGRVQYAIKQDTGNKIRAGLFGKSKLPEAKEYFDSKASVLGEKQSEFLKNSADKMGTYKIFQQNRQLEDGQKTGDGQGMTSGNTFQYLKDGEIKEVDLSFQPNPPKMTGLEELDKKARSRFYGEITSKQNDIYELYEQKQLTADAANKQLLMLEQMRSTYKSAGKKGRKVALKKVSMPKSTPIKLKTAKLAKIQLKASTPKKFKIGKSTKAK